MFVTLKFLNCLNNILIKVFNISEDLIIGILRLNDFAHTHSLTQKRDIENKGKHYLLNYLLNKSVEIEYDSFGKPYLTNDFKHISISHSFDKMAIIINTKEPTGIDIEMIGNKILNIKHKFLSEIELENANNDVEKTLIYWGAKETLYKIYGLKGVDFIKNISVNPFEKQNYGNIMATMNMPNYNHTFELNYLKIENYILVYALKKIHAC